jgi:hypothetical protein
MGSCKSKNKISNQYILDVQHMLREFKDLNIKMLIELDIQNKLVYNKDRQFDYQMCKDEFIRITIKMDDILNKFQYRNKELLATLKKTPDEFWKQHIRFCREKHAQMERYDDALGELLYKRHIFETNYKKYDELEKKRLINDFKLQNYCLQGDIAHFNKTMCLPNISREDINPRLSHVLRNAREPVVEKANPFASN